jgi:predicted DNA-binding protein
MRDRIMSIRFSEKEKERLEEAAKEMGCPQADVVRWALRRELAEPVETDLAR